MKTVTNKKWHAEYETLITGLAKVKNKREAAFHILKCAEEISEYYMWPKIVEKYAELGFKNKAEDELVKFTAIAEKKDVEFEKCYLLRDCAKLYLKFGKEEIAKDLFFKALEIIENLEDPQEILDLTLGFNVSCISRGKEILDRLWLIAIKLPTRKAIYVVQNLVSQYIKIGKIEKGVIHIIEFKEFITEDYEFEYESAFNGSLKSAAIKHIELGETDKALEIIINIKDAFSLENIAIKFIEYDEPEKALHIIKEIEDDCLGSSIVEKFSEYGYFEEAVNIASRIDEDYSFCFYGTILSSDKISLEQLKKIEHKIPDIGKSDLVIEYIKRGNIKSAEEIINDFEKGSYNRIKTIAALSRAYAETGEKEKTEQLCEEVLDSRDPCYDAITDVMDAYIELGQKDKAGKIAKSYLTEDFFMTHGNIHLIIKFIRVCSKKDLAEKMQDIMNKLTQAFNDLSVAVCFASALWQQGWKDEARTVINFLVEKAKKMKECSASNGKTAYFAEIKVDRLAKALVEYKLDELFNEFFPDLLEAAMFNKENSDFTRPNALITFAGLPCPF